MEIEIREYTLDRMDDVLEFERELRRQEDFWGWEIDEAYVESVRKSFADPSFADSISLVAYAENKVVGRIDACMLKSRFDGSTKAYLDWICVLKSHRHQGVGQALLKELRRILKEKNIPSLIALTASNEEAQRFYQAVEDAEMHDIGIWIEVK